MKLNFTKMNGAGNDFVVIYNQNFKPDPVTIQKICNRYFGIGADGVLLIQKSDIADFSVRYFNSDGSGDTLCVNGARCAVLFGYLNNLNGKNCRFEFINKVFDAEILDSENIKLTLSYSPEIKLSKEIDFLNKKLNLSYINIGSKHIIIEWTEFYEQFKQEIKNENFGIFDVNSYGRLLKNHVEFSPDGVNVNFIERINDKLYEIRTYERGVENETLACGSGSIASALHIYLVKNILPPIKFLTRGGKTLEVNFDYSKNSIDNINLTGPAEKNFEGIIEL